MFDMFEKIKKSGWYEEKDPMTMNDKMEPVAPRHHEAALARRLKELEKMGTTIIRPCAAEKEISKLNFDIPKKDFEKFILLVEGFSKRKNAIVQIEKDGERANVTLPKEFVDEFMNLLKKSGFEFLEEVIEYPAKGANNK
jgi:hypothetical protein